MNTVELLGKTLKKTACLAPMAGTADTVYRELCVEQGAVMVTSEMISAKGLCYNSKGSAELCRIREKERPMGLQLFGSEPECFAKAAAMVQKYEPDWIDLNMGCPVPKVVNTGAGSALMRNSELAMKCIQAVIRESSVPVTVKMRTGWNAEEINAVEFAQCCESAGAAMLTVHGRTKAQLYSGQADWEMIKQVKQAVNIPVIGNGDIRSGKDCQEMYDTTGVDLVAIGRGSYGNPWIFREVQAYLEKTPYRPPTAEERMEMLLRHIRMILDRSEKPETLAIREARKHASWYMAGMKHAAKYRALCYQLSSYAEAEELAEKFLCEVHE